MKRLGLQSRRPQAIQGKKSRRVTVVAVGEARTKSPGLQQKRSKFCLQISCPLLTTDYEFLLFRESSFSSFCLLLVVAKSPKLCLFGEKSFGFFSKMALWKNIQPTPDLPCPQSCAQRSAAEGPELLFPPLAAPGVPLGLSHAASSTPFLSSSMIPRHHSCRADAGQKVCMDSVKVSSMVVPISHQILVLPESGGQTLEKIFVPDGLGIFSRISSTDPSFNKEKLLGYSQLNK